MVDTEIIIKNFNEYFETAEYCFGKEKFNSAVTLYYKALVELCDLELSRKLNKIGINHTERFNLLEAHSPIMYNIASKLFRFYRDSYNKEISKVIAEEVKKQVENAKKIIFNQ